MVHLDERTSHTQRIVLLDVVRAVAVISMVIGHVANYSFLWRSSHFAYYVWDGAQLFMLVSGIVVGIVHHRIVDRHGMRASAIKLAKRAGLLYVLQLGLVLLGLMVAYSVPGMRSSGFWPEGIEDWPHALEWATVLGANPIYINFLSSYVVILLAAIPMVYLLWTRHVAVVLTVATAIYLIGLRLPDAFTLPNGPQALAGFNNATWLALFLTGLVVGWNWDRWNVSGVLRSRGVSVFSAIAWVALLGLALIDALRPQELAAVNWLFDKDQMAPGRMLASWVFFVVLFWLASDIERQPWGWRIIRPMDVLGSRALDSVVILTIAAILVPAITLQPSSGRLAQVVAVFVVLVCWAWAHMHRRRSVARKTAVASKEWEQVRS